jgi:superfamily II DNA or RNA helicase
MISLDVKWSEPYPFNTERGEWWKRDWLIPANHRSEFFVYWRGNSFKLKERGFGVFKKDEEWYLSESKTAKHLFKEFSHLAPVEKPSVDFFLTPHKVKDESGLRSWQVDAVGKICAALEKWGCAIDGSDLGVGKTYTACGVVRELDMDILVVCPKAVRESWQRVIKNHFKMAGRMVGIINYELLTRGRSDSDIASYVRNKKTHVNEFIWKIPKNTLIVWDESQKLKGSTTKNSKVCLLALKQGYKMLFCSATNATNPLELRTVGMSLKLFDNNKQYYQWLYLHGVNKGRFGLEFNNNKEVLTKLNRDIFIDRGIRLTRDIIPNFPESQITAQCYDMEEENQKKINSLYDEMKTELKRLNSKVKKEGKNNTSQLTAILRARQKIELVKVPLFIEMIEDGLENGMSVVVFVNFTDTIEALSKRLNTKCIVNGQVKDKERQDNIDNFQSDKERVILVNIAAGGAGLSLHDLNGKYPRLSIISPSYSAVQMRQATGRVWRDSAKTKSIQKLIFVSGTVEVQVCEAVNKKLDNLDFLNDGDMEDYETTKHNG